MIYVTSDTHYAHSNICKATSNWSDKSGCRNFPSLEEMNETLIENVNKVVKENDILYHLGDVAFGNPNNSKIFLESLNCRNIIILIGNHDNVNNFKDIKNVSGVYHYLRLSLNKQPVVMMHFPIMVWDGNSRGSWMLHGHCHGSLTNSIGKMLDVGVDCFNFAPVSFDELKEIMDSKPIIALDHHDPKRM
jgi:calcineurin-like phosphoesterase family protein